MSSSESWTTEDVLVHFAGNPLLKKYAAEIRAAELTGADLGELDADAVADIFGTKSSFGAKKVLNAVRSITNSASATTTEARRLQMDNTPDEVSSEDTKQAQLSLPKGKTFAYFASHVS